MVGEGESPSLYFRVPAVAKAEREEAMREREEARKRAGVVVAGAGGKEAERDVKLF